MITAAVSAIAEIPRTAYVQTRRRAFPAGALVFEAGSGVGSDASGTAASASTALAGAINRYPRRPAVAIKRGFSALSERAWRSLLTDVFKLVSKSTNVSADHRRRRNSSRVT